MRAAVRALTSMIVGAVALLLVAAPAHAADEISIDHIEASAGMLRLVVSVDAIPGGAAADPDTVEVSLDGMVVDAEVKSVAAGDIQRSTVLVLDASNSMERDGKFAAAQTAVTAYLDAAPDDVSIGLVTFAGGVKEGIEPTTDHDAVRAALESVTLAKGTAVYDGIAEGTTMLGDEGSRSLLVLSDGADTSSSTTLEVASGQAAEAGVVVDVVSLASAARAQELSSLAEQTGGSVVPADPAALSAVFTDQAQALAQQLLVTVDVPEGVEDEASLDVAVQAGNATYVDSAFVTVPADATNPTVTVVESGKSLVGTPVMLMGALALGLGLIGILGIIFVGAADTRSTSARRLDAYFDAGKGSGGGNRRSKGSKAGTDLKGSAVALADKIVHKDLETRISQRLTGAGSAFTVSEWVLLHAGIAVGVAFVGFLFNGPLLGFLGLMVGVAAPWFYLKWRHKRRLNKFNGQLAQTLGLMAGGLQAGLSLPQAVDTVVREGHEPMAGELRRALVEQRLGLDITDSLESVGQRMDSADFSWVVMAIRIQREVGGNLAEILHTVADTIREREYLRRQVRALSAEGRLSGYILTGLPPVIFIYMLFVNPDYVRVLYTTTMGYFLLALAVVLLSLGSYAMSRLSKVEV